MNHDFHYLIEKIEQSEFLTEPFKHLEIRDFLSPEHFALVTSDPQIRLATPASTEALVDVLDDKGYIIIPFPGCVSEAKAYLAWYNGASGRKLHGATESFGIVYRLQDIRSELLIELNRFLISDKLKRALIEKFAIKKPVDVDGGIQKYLHGYEISPHPDIRRKALTWMLNINPDDRSEDNNYHTHYLKLKKEWEFIPVFWDGNADYDRDWLPWHWCDTVKQQTENNSIVIFSPSSNTIHAVRAKYDHLSTQRTQIYGNLWYEDKPLPKVPYQQFDLRATTERLNRNGSRYEKFKTTVLGKNLIAMRNSIRPATGVIRRND